MKGFGEEHLLEKVNRDPTVKNMVSGRGYARAATGHLAATAALLRRTRKAYMSAPLMRTSQKT